MEQLSKVSRSWLKEEDDKLRRQINAESNQNWKSVATKAGLKRSANSCRLRYINHLKPRTRPGKLTVEEKLLTLEFRSRWGGKNWWSKIANKLLPGRTDNDVKNFWHTLAKKANREGCDENSEAILKKRAELVQMINDRGRFAMDYSSLISSDAYDLLKELFPHIAGGAAATEAADSSPTGFDVGTPGRVGDTVLSQSVAKTEVDQLTPDVETPQSRVAVERQFQKGFTARFFYYGGDPGAAPGSDPVPEAEPGNFYSIVPVQVQQHQQVVNTGLFHHGKGPTGFNVQVPAALGIAFTETSNQTLSHMQEYSDPHVYSTLDVAPQFHAPVEQQGLNGGCLDHGGGPIGLNEAMAAAALGNTTSNEIDNACSSAEKEELDENKAFAEYFNFDDF